MRPNPLDVHAAHSIYFQILGEQGFIGLFLFMSVGAFTWFAAGDAKRRAVGIPNLAWVASLVDMLKVSMIGYAVGGAFLSLAYFDVPYYVVVVAVATRELVLAAQNARAARVVDRFGSVLVGEDPAEEPARPPRYVDAWRGEGAFAKRTLTASVPDLPNNGAVSMRRSRKLDR